eukprot:8541915-Pyramimonas_sp.AAC.1
MRRPAARRSARQGARPPTSRPEPSRSSWRPGARARRCRRTSPCTTYVQDVPVGHCGEGRH